jgi:hypothetical protein
MGLHRGDAELGSWTPNWGGHPWPMNCFVLLRIWATEAGGQMPWGPFGDLESSSPSAGGRRHPPRQRLGRFRRALTIPSTCARFGSHHRILILIPWLSGAPSSLSPDPFAKAKVHGRNDGARRIHLERR